VRLLPANAEKLFALVEQEGVLNTTVVLTGVAPSGAPAVARRRVQPDQLEPQYAQQPRYAQPQYDAYGRPIYYGNPYYAQPQYRDQYGRPYVLQQPGYVYRDPYGDPYQQRRGSMFPFQ
jgi:hypothetical protein